jgi:hypothetical protein
MESQVFKENVQETRMTTEVKAYAGGPVIVEFLSTPQPARAAR